MFNILYFVFWLGSDGRLSVFFLYFDVNYVMLINLWWKNWWNVKIEMCKRLYFFYLCLVYFGIIFKCYLVKLYEFLKLLIIGINENVIIR